MQLIFVDQRDRPGRTLYTSAVEFEDFPVAVVGPFGQTLQEVEMALLTWAEVEVAYIFANPWPAGLHSLSKH